MAVSQIQSSIGWKKGRRRAPEPGVAAQRSANFVVEGMKRAGIIRRIS
jgi:hypothetical protein